MIRIEDILEKVERYNPQADLDLIRRAYVFSAKEHRGQERRSGEPYLVHPLEVADILAEMKLDEVSIAVGLLHDILEDTSVDRATLESYFGPEVSAVVEGVTKLSGISFESSEAHQAENFRKMLMAMTDDIRVILVKLGDRLHNMRTLEFLPEEKQRRIAKETLEIYAPLAHRLGIGWMKAELEDTALKHLDPQAFQRIKEGLAGTRRTREERTERLRALLGQRLQTEGVPGRVEGRAKHIYSIYQKMKVKEVAFEEIYDLVGLRVIIDSGEKSECYRVLGMVHDLWKLIPGRFRDYVNLPKENMYQSLHTTVIADDGLPVEIQIRTEEMHRLAEEGVAVHWIYKSLLGTGKGTRHQLRWLRELMEWQEELQDPREFLDTVKMNLFPDEVYVFTPRGEVKAFPRGATPVDFAYSIHTDIGHRCVGAKINGAIVPLKYQLATGDHVEILTSAHHKPNRDWLRLAVTARARAKIRAFIKAEERERSRELGREILERELHRAGLSLNSLRRSGRLEELARLFDSPDEENLLADIGYGKVTPGMLQNVLAPPEEPPAPAKASLSPAKEGLPAGRPDDQKRVEIKGVEDVLIRFSKCCNPVPGDEIIGFITRGKGLAVHTRACPNMSSLDCNPDRLIELSWAHGEPGLHPVKVAVISEDQPGMLAAISAVISKEGVNIVRAEVRTAEDQRGYYSLTIEIRDLTQLEKVIRLLGRTRGVISVERQ